MLAEVTRMGFPPRGWYATRRWVWGRSRILYGMVSSDGSQILRGLLDGCGLRRREPARVPGARPGPAQDNRQEGDYQGDDRPDVASVATPPAGLPRGGVDNAWTATAGYGSSQRFKWRALPTGDLERADLIVKSGAAAGKMLPMQRVAGDIDPVGQPAWPPWRVGAGRFCVGRHQGRRRGADRQLQLPRRSVLSPPSGSDARLLCLEPVPQGRTENRSIPSDRSCWDPSSPPPRPVRSRPGQFQGKMIVVEIVVGPGRVSLAGRLVRIQGESRSLGPRFNDNFRLWYTDHALHGDFERQGDPPIPSATSACCIRRCAI